MPSHARRADRRGTRSSEFVFPHRNSPPSDPRVGDPQSPSCIHARLPLRHQANFAALLPRAAIIGFFYAMLQKDHATEYQLPLGELPSRRWLDATVLRICDLFYWLKCAFNCPRPRLDCRGDVRTGSAPEYRFAIVKACTLARAKRPSLGSFELQPPGRGVRGLEGRMTAAPGWVSGEPDSSCGNGLSGNANKRSQFCRAGPRTDPFGSARLRRRFRQTESCSEPRRQSDELFALDDRRDAPSPTLQAWVEVAWLSYCRGSTSLNETRRCRASSQSARRGKPRLCTTLTRLSPRSEG